MALRTLSLCTGIGGIELGLASVRPDHQLVGVVERQAYCAATLVARMEEASLDAAPIWDDLATFDGNRFRGCVDLICAGYPCQPDSVAGARGGADDERWIWPEVCRVIREVGPVFVFVENVPGHLSGTFGRVLGDLAALGFDAEWDCIPACSVGAPHERDRVFLLAAHPDRLRVWLQSERDQRGGRGARAPERGHAEPLLDGAAGPLADAHSDGRQGERVGSERVDEGEQSSFRRHLDRRRGAGNQAADAELLRHIHAFDGAADGHRRRTSASPARGGAATADARRPRRKGKGLPASAHDRAVPPSDADRARLEGTDDARRVGRRGDVAGDGGDQAADADELGRAASFGSAGARGVAEPDGGGDRSYWQRRPAPVPTFRRVVDGVPHRLDRDWADRIHALGNGVVSEAAAQAWTTLFARITEGR